MCCVVGILGEIGLEIEVPTQFIMLHDVSGCEKRQGEKMREVCFIVFLRIDGPCTVQLWYLIQSATEKRSIATFKKK